MANEAKAHSKSGTVTNLHLVEIKQMNIPLPPLDVQREIAFRIEAEQEIVKANKRLIEIYEEKIKQVIPLWGRCPIRDDMRWCGRGCAEGESHNN